MTFRAIRRICLFLLITFALSPWLIMGNMLLSIYRPAQLRWRHFIIRLWAKGIRWVMGMRIRTEGPLPAAPFFLVSNHLSYVDIPLLFCLRPCVFIAKQEVQSWPLLGPLARMANTLFIDRSNRRDLTRVNKNIAENINACQGLVLFAEGTSTHGETVRPFKPSLLEIPARRQLPVYCASISYGTPPGSPGADQVICWWGDMTFPDHLFKLFKLPYFEAVVVFSSTPIVCPDRKKLARLAWETVHRNFIPIVSTPLQETEETCLTDNT